VRVLLRDFLDQVVILQVLLQVRLILFQAWVPYPSINLHNERHPREPSLPQLIHLQV
jgi:hypothetical protein